jgi:hypothetical protein
MRESANRVHNAVPGVTEAKMETLVEKTIVNATRTTGKTREPGDKGTQEARIEFC